MSLPKRETEDQTMEERLSAASLDLPEWLIELKPVAQPERPAPAAKMVSQVKTTSDKPAPSSEESWQASASSLVSEDDLPAWLKALSDEQPVEPVVQTAQPDVQPTASFMEPPAWVEVTQASLADEPSASVVVEPPPVWAARRVKGRLDELVVEPASLAGDEPRLAPAEVKGGRRVNFAALVALLLLVILVVVVAMVAFPMLT